MLKGGLILFKVGLANLSDLAFSFDGFKLLADRASRKNILVKGVSSARLPVEGSRLGKVRLQQRL
ncbi:ORF in transposon ISC1225 [Saccharolobus solfataricus]|uniref:ORF in transposon ISC1225 n=1 Tax=Saccharolobus solfataricus TaxID=2287 RepID=A0A157T2Y4_SACSO|nr:ORF in transposon ISC1225 [Saccharolobus solfataricus]